MLNRSTLNQGLPFRSFLVLPGSSPKDLVYYSRSANSTSLFRILRDTQDIANFGPFSHDLLVGNFGSGQIAAFDPSSGKFVGLLRSRGREIMISGLWGLGFGKCCNFENG